MTVQMSPVMASAIFDPARRSCQAVSPMAWEQGWWKPRYQCTLYQLVMVFAVTISPRLRSGVWLMLGSK